MSKKYAKANEIALKTSARQYGTERARKAVRTMSGIAPKSNLIKLIIHYRSLSERMAVEPVRDEIMMSFLHRIEAQQIVRNGSDARRLAIVLGFFDFKGKSKSKLLKDCIAVMAGMPIGDLREKIELFDMQADGRSGYAVLVEALNRETR